MAYLAPSTARIVDEIVDATDITLAADVSVFEPFVATNGYLPAFTVPAGEWVWFEYSFDVKWNTTVPDSGYLNLSDANHGTFYSADMPSLPAGNDAVFQGCTQRFLSDGAEYHVAPQLYATANGGGKILGTNGAPSYFRAWTQPA